MIAVPFAVWRAHTSIGGNLVGVDANVTLFGFALMLYALFNAILLCSFYKTAYQVGTAFLKAIIPTSLLMLAMEISVHIPALAWLDGYDTARQLPVLAVGAVIYAAGWPLTFRRAAALYEKVDL